MVVFDIMTSHFSMMRWHEAGLAQHKADLATIQATKLSCKQRLLHESSQQAGDSRQTKHPGQTLPAMGQSAQSAGSPGSNLSSGLSEAMQPDASHVVVTQPTLQQLGSPSQSSSGLFAGTQPASAVAADSPKASGRSQGLTSPIAAQLVATGTPTAAGTSVQQPLISGSRAGSMQDQAGNLDSPRANPKFEQTGPADSQNPPDTPSTPMSNLLCKKVDSSPSPAAGQPSAGATQEHWSESANPIGQSHQSAAAQPKMSVRFDSQTPASPEPVVAGSHQHHVPHHSIHFRAHIAGDQVQAVQKAGAKIDQQQRWRVELEVDPHTRCRAEKLCIKGCHAIVKMSVYGNTLKGCCEMSIHFSRCHSSLGCVAC